MSLFDNVVIEEHVIEKQDIYHEEHLLHWIVLFENEEWEEAYSHIEVC